MKPTEIKDLVAGLLTIIFLAIATGQYGHLKRFARVEVAKALKPRSGFAFFPKADKRNAHEHFAVKSDLGTQHASGLPRTECRLPQSH